MFDADATAMYVARAVARFGDVRTIARVRAVCRRTAAELAPVWRRIQRAHNAPLRWRRLSQVSRWCAHARSPVCVAFAMSNGVTISLRCAPADPYADADIEIVVHVGGWSDAQVHPVSASYNAARFALSSQQWNVDDRRRAYAQPWTYGGADQGCVRRRTHVGGDVDACPAHGFFRTMERHLAARHGVVVRAAIATVAADASLAAAMKRARRDETVDAYERRMGQTA